MFKLGAPEIDYINFLVETCEGESLEDIKKKVKDFQEEINVLKEKYDEETQLRLEAQKRREQEEQKGKEAESKLRKSVIGFYEFALSPQKIAELVGGELDWVYQIIETHKKKNNL